MKILDGHLAGRDFMEGGRLTIGDITTGVMAYRWFGLGNAKEAMPNFARYYDGLTERAAFRTHVMLPLT
jgi:glutathione S-transferase